MLLGALLFPACASKAAGGTSGGTSSASPSGGGSSGGKPALVGKIVRASEALHVVASPGGEFTIAIPSGWTINPSQDGFTFSITARGQAQPEIYVVAAIPVSDLRANAVIVQCAQNAYADVLTCASQELLYQLQDSGHKWSAPDSLQALLQATTAVNGTAYGSPQVTSLPGTAASFQVAARTSQGLSLTSWGVIAMGYLDNPPFHGYTSLAFLTGCDASPAQATSLQQMCNRAFSSFKPSPTWLSKLANQQVQHYQTELGLIAQQIRNNQQLEQILSSFRSNMQRMQQEEFKSMQEVNTRVGENWRAALGGQANMQTSDGQVYLVDGGYTGYCRTNLGNVMESYSHLGVGQSFADNLSESCADVMSQPTS